MDFVPDESAVNTELIEVRSAALWTLLSLVLMLRFSSASASASGYMLAQQAALQLPYGAWLRLAWRCSAQLWMQLLRCNPTRACSTYDGLDCRWTATRWTCSRRWACPTCRA